MRSWVAALLLLACQPSVGPIASRVAAIDPVIPADRRIDWAPGISGGIPHRTVVCARADAAAYGDGVADATASLQSLIDACPAEQVVLLPAGAYRVTGALKLERSVVLRGEGPTRTHLLLDNQAAPAAIELGRKDAQLPGVAVVSGLQKGSTEVVVADASSFEVGDVVLLDEERDVELATGPDCLSYARTPNPRPIGQRAEVIGKAGNALRLDAPLHLTYRAELHPELSKAETSARLQGMGVEDLAIDRSSDYGGHGWLVLMANVSRSWLRNVEGHKASGAHVELIACHRCVVADSFFHHAWNYGPVGEGYGIRLSAHTSESLVENNALYWLNVPITLIGTGGGNVIAYNYSGDARVTLSDWQSPDVTADCMLPHMELFEGNWLAHVAVYQEGGNAVHLTLFRNHLTARRRTLPDSDNVSALQVSNGGWYLNVVANVMMSEGQGGTYESTGPTSGPVAFELASDEQLKATLLREGNFVWATGRVESRTTSPASVRALPASLYLPSKPAFWENRPWPLVDPERAERVGTLPAKERFDALGRTGAW